MLIRLHEQQSKLIPASARWRLAEIQRRLLGELSTLWWSSKTNPVDPFCIETRDSG